MAKVIPIRIALIGCVKTKQRGRHRARDLYTSPLFRQAYHHVVSRFDEVFILSAKYGLVSPGRYLESYEVTLRTMSLKTRRTWAGQVARDIRRLTPGNSEIHFFCGRRYWELLIDQLAPRDTHTPLRGLGLGQQLQWYQRNS